MKEDNKQLGFLEQLEEIEKAEKPYRNGLGELLPWELPEGQSYD